ncbi:P30 adhesin [Papilio machaon]|uniref:p30 adhesin n=1 Tax=Papilio machaon TaxID=76193 RepID=A0A0N1IP90_PAPMA|nr:P30 adhesin [Papilio machaon]
MHRCRPFLSDYGAYASRPGLSPYAPRPGRTPYAPRPGRTPYAPRPGRSPYAPRPGRSPYAPRPGRSPHLVLTLLSRTMANEGIPSNEVEALCKAPLPFTKNTSETEEVNTNELSSTETHNDDVDNSKINKEETSQEIKNYDAKNLYDEYERRRRLQSIHDNLATKLQKALVKKLKSPEYSQRINLTTVEKYLLHDIDIPNGRRNFNNKDNELNEVPLTKDNTTEVDGRRNYVKKLTYIIDNQPNNNAQVININDANMHDLNAVNQAIASSRAGNRFVKFNNNFFDYSNHLRAQNHLNDFRQVAEYLKRLMDADNHINPYIIDILKGANELNLAEINNFDSSQLVQINKIDLEYLKKYIILIINRYGMTPYVFKLLEYVNLLEGRPRNEIYLIFKILSNQQAVYGLNRIESDQLKAHLQYILNEYGKSPLILPFVRNIGGIQFETRGNNRIHFIDFGNLDPSSHLNRDYMRKIYLHLLQIYNNNQNILQILQNINNIYNNRNSVFVLPKLDLNDYKNIYYLSQNDLYLLAKYISQIQKQIGDNTYLKELLIYIKKLQTLDQEIDVNVIKDDHNAVKGLNLTGLYKILLDINNRNDLKPEISAIINRLINMKTVTLQDMNKIMNDIKVLKDYLIQNHMFEYDQLLIKILYELNNARADENLPPIEDDTEKWITVKFQDLELIYEYLLKNEKFRSNPYLLVFIKEILQIIERGKINPYEGMVYKFRHSDLMKLYNIIQLYETDKENPIYVMIFNYLNQGKEKDHSTKYDNGTIPNPDLYLIREYFSDDQINLDIIYKFLLYEIESGNPNEVLLELLQLLKRTLLLPNGELKINVINLNGTQPYRQIKPNDLQQLYLYLQKLIEDNTISFDLLEFYRKEKRKHTLNIEIFYNATKESLNRLRNFLLILIKEHGENPYILEVLTEINHILDIPDEATYIINNTNSDLNEDDLILLIKYFSEINLIENNTDLINILEYLQDIKEKIQKGDTKEWIYINAQDLELIYQYLLSKEKFLHSPYLSLFVNEILPLIQRGKQNPYENITYKFKHLDLLQLYNLILSDEKDKNNPIYIKILNYLDLNKDVTKNNNGTMPDVDLHILKEYFGHQINMDLVFKFVTHEIKSGNSDELLFELLQFIKRTLLLPNGQLIVKNINLDDIEPLEVIQPKDLQILYLYLQELIKHEHISVKLLEYMERQKQKEKLILEIFSDVTQESLIRIRNYLLTLLKELGENQFVLDLLFEINNILGIPINYDKHENVQNGTKYDLTEVDIKLLMKYFSEINQSDNNDVIKILNYLYETQNRIYKENNTKEKLIYINLNDLEHIYEYLIGKETFRNNPYLVIFSNDILPLIQEGKLNPFENLAYKLRHFDLQKIFNLIISQEKDKENPIYKKILKYLDIYKDINNNNGTTENVDLHVLSEYFGQDQVNLDIVYKFLINEMNSGNKKEILTEFLEFIKHTLLLPNGQLKIKIIYFKEIELTGKITSSDLQRLYLYLQKLMEDDNIRIKLLDYIKIYKEIFELFSNATKESLNRIRNFLLILIKERGENPYITEVLVEINIILGIPESKNDHLYVLNGTNSEFNEEDLKLLVKYFSLINKSDKNTDVTNILEILHETEETIKNKEEKSNEQWIYINAEDLQKIYQYLLSKETFVNSPYLVVFVNEILPFIQRAKQRPYENLLYKLKYKDLLQLYNTVLSHEKEKENPIYVMILQYLDDFKDETKNNNEATQDVDFNKLNEYFEDKRINLEILYKFLTHEIESGSHSKVLVELLQLIKKTLLLPNGQLKVKVIHIDGTDPNIHPKDLQKLYFYLQKLIENEILSIELLDYMKKYKQKEKEMHDIFIDITPESLSRLRNFLIILIKELGENPFVLDLLFEINHMLGVPESNDKHPQIMNGTNFEVNEKELELLIKYFTEINIYGKNSDLINILDFLQETKEKVKHDNEDSKGDWISVNVSELELIYQYLLSKEKYLNSPYVELFIKEIRPLIQLGKEHPNDIVIYKFKVMDLLKIYKYLVSHEKDEENPIFVRILHYLEHVTNNITKYDNGTNVDLNVLNEYFGDNQINLDIVYKFLLHKISTGNLNKELVDLLEVLKRIQLPNGELKVKIINLNETEPKQINPKDLNEIYLYLQNLIDDNTLSIDLLEYYTKNIKEHKQIMELLSNTPKESLNRLRNYLIVLIKAGDGNPVILQIIFEINRILGIPENDDKQRYNVNNTNLDESDLETLEKSLSFINGPDNIDILKVIENIMETKKKIKEQQDNTKESKLFKSYVLEIIDDKNISPHVKFIFQHLLDVGFYRLNQSSGYSEFDFILREAIPNLGPGDLNVLIKYLQMLIHKFNPVYLVQRLLPYVNKIRENYKYDPTVKHINTTHPNDTLVVNITRHDLDVFNKYLLKLINLYGENSNILHIIYKINNIKETSEKEYDWFKLITKNSNAAPTLKVGDINDIIKYLVNLINKQGATGQLIKILRDFSNLPKDTIEDVNRKVTPINSTHTLVILDDDDVNKVKSNLVKIINDYGSNPYLVNILRVISPKGQDDNSVHSNQPNIYTFTKLNQNDLNILTNYILHLIEQQGPSTEFIEILYFIYEINGDVNEERKDNESEQYVLEITKEINKLRDNKIIEILRNMDRNTLITLYIDMLETIFSTPNINNDFTRIMVKLLEVYKKEESPIKKYIILKWYEYLIQNKGVSYNTLRNPDFINNLLELDDNNGTNIVITTDKYSILTPHDYSKDIDKILNELINNTLRNKPPKSDSLQEDSRKMNNSTDERKPDLRDRIEEEEIKGKSCLQANRKFKDISKVLNKIKKLHRHGIDLSNDDLERIFDIVVVFAKQLKYERHRSKIQTSLLIAELENRLLSQRTEKCTRSDTVKQIISTVVVHLRDIISYLKTANFSKDEIMIIIKSTLEDDIMPDIKAISVQECTSAANKEILDALLSNIYAKTYEQDENMGEVTDLEKFSTENLLKEMSKVKDLSTSQGETNE